MKLLDFRKLKVANLKIIFLNSLKKIRRMEDLKKISDWSKIHRF
jgi:hypothetical protein